MRRVLPGFGLTMGFTLCYVSLLVLISLSTILLKSTTLSWSTFWGTVLSPRALASYRLSLGASLLGALLKAAPRVHGQCRTRWSCATLALTLETKRGIKVSAETMRRWVHEVGWAWRRAKLVAKDDAPRFG